MAGKKRDDQDEQHRHRSPNYPAVGLRDAVERIRALVEKDGKAGAKLDVAAKHIGFSGPHGTARAVLSALRKFGLTADQNGRIVPTQLAMDILHFPSEHERSIAAKRDAATSPRIYQQLLDQLGHSGNLPSPESLRAELVADWGFNPKAVEAFVNDFLDTLVYAGLLEGNRLTLSPGAADEPPHEAPKPLAVWVGAAASPAPPPLPAVQSMPGKTMRDLTLPLMDNEVALLRVPTPLTEDNFEYLMQQIGLLKRGLVSRAVPAPSGAPAGQESGVTLELRHKLLARGLPPHEIAKMTAEQAWEYLIETDPNVHAE